MGASRRVLMILAAAAGLLAATCGLGQEPPRAPPEIRQVFWQVLPAVESVWVDARGSAWLRTYAKCSIEESYRAEVKLMPSDLEPLLSDRQGRLWLNSRYEGRTPTRCYDGKQWETLAFRARAGFVGSSGRVFLIDDRSVRVLGEAGWSEHRLLPEPNLHVSWRFVEDPSGRVWLCARDALRENWPGGAWTYQKAQWTHHAGAAWPDAKASALVPLAQGRLLVILAEQRLKPRNYLVWRPGQDAPAPGQDEFLPKCTAEELRLLGTDDDGNRYVWIRGLVRDGNALGRESTAAYFSPDGQGALLGADGKEFLDAVHWARSAGWPGDRLHFSLKDKGAWDGQRLIPPPVPGDIFGKDSEGRIYYRGFRNGVGVVWPKYEKPGDVIRPGRDPGLRLGAAFQDRSGGIWFLAGWALARGDRRGQLLRWDGSSWQDTPVKVPPHPPWIAHPMPPWSAWSRSPTVLLGRSGDLLVVVVRDVYQDAFRQTQERGLPPPEWREVLGNRPGKEPADMHPRVAEGKPQYWLDAWLFRKGQWSGPMRIEDAFRMLRPWLAEEFTLPVQAPGWFGLVSDGKTVWSACDGTVRAIAPDGSAHTWQVPIEGDWKRQKLPPTRLILLGGGKVLCIYPGDRKAEMSYLSAAEKGIAHHAPPKDSLPRLPDTVRYEFTSLYHFPDASGGQAWCACKGPDGLTAYQWDGGGWRPWPGLGPVCCQDGSGGIWFHYSDKVGRERGYAVWKEGKFARLPWPEYLPAGRVSCVAKDRLVASCGRFLVTLVPDAAAPAGWKIGRLHVLAGMSEEGPVLYDGKGSLIGPNGWSATYDPAWGEK